MVATFAPTTTNNASFNNSSETFARSLVPNALVILIGILGVIFNGVLLVAIICNSSQILTSNGAYMVTNVAVADFLTGIMSVVYGIHNQVTSAKNSAITALFWTSIEASLITVFVMSLTRYLAIVHPFKAETWLSKKSTLYCCAAIWLISAICGALKVFYSEIMNFLLATVFEMTTLATLFLYYKLFTNLEHRKHMLLIKKTTISKHVNKELRREYNLTTVVVIITVIMIITVLPYHIAGQIFLAHRLLITPPHGPKNVLTFLTYYMPIELMNFVLNPIVYAWRLPKYRKALVRTFKLC